MLSVKQGLVSWPFFTSLLRSSFPHPSFSHEAGFHFFQRPWIETKFSAARLAPSYLNTTDEEKNIKKKRKFARRNRTFIPACMATTAAFT